MWDHETDDFSDKPNIEVDSFTAAGMLSYSVLNWLSASTAVGKGFATTENSIKELKFTSGD